MNEKEMARIELGYQKISFTSCNSCKKWFSAFEIIQIFPEGGQKPYFLTITSKIENQQIRYYCPFCGAVHNEDEETLPERNKRLQSLQGSAIE